MDIPRTPRTNSLPIRILRPARDSAAVIEVIYLGIPDDAIQRTGG